jgi:hypothetical protein
MSGPKIGWHVDVFLSYKREDQDAARAITKDLEAEHYSVFFDVKIPVGESWDSTIERELGAARAVVVLWSPRSTESKWVRREAREGMARRILCPALIADCKVPLEFSDVQTASLIGRRAGDLRHSEWRRLCDHGIARGAVEHPLAPTLAEPARAATIETEKRIILARVKDDGYQTTLFELAIDGKLHAVEYNFRLLSSCFILVDGVVFTPASKLGNKYDSRYEYLFLFTIGDHDCVLRYACAATTSGGRLSSAMLTVDGQTVFDGPIS